MSLLKHKLKNRFVKSVLLITGGTAFAQLLNTLLSPLITRIYSPEEYGYLTLYTSILGFLTIISSLKYEHGIAIASNDKKAINILALCLILLTIFVGTVSLFLVIYSNVYSLEFYYIYFIPIGIFIVGLYNIYFQWALRKGFFKIISKTKILQSIYSNLIKVGLGVLNFGAIGLILGTIVGTGAGVTSLSKTHIENRRRIFKEIKIKRIRWAARRYKKFPIYFAPSQLLNNAGIHLPVFLITFMYGHQVIGLYGLAHTIVSLPTQLIGNSVGEVFYSEAAKIGKSNPERLKSLSRKLFSKLVILGFFPLIILICFGPFLFSLIFGENWEGAGEYARILAFLVFSRLIFMPISRVFEVFEKQKEVLFLDLFRITLVILVFIFAIVMSLDSYWTIFIYSVVMSIIYFITFLLAQMFINTEIKKKQL